MSYCRTRYYLLNELLHNRARKRIGSISEATARKEKRLLQKELVKLRVSRE